DADPQRLRLRSHAWNDSMSSSSCSDEEGSLGAPPPVGVSGSSSGPEPPDGIDLPAPGGVWACSGSYPAPPRGSYSEPAGPSAASRSGEFGVAPGEEPPAA